MWMTLEAAWGHDDSVVCAAYESYLWVPSSAAAGDHVEAQTCVVTGGYSNICGLCCFHHQNHIGVLGPCGPEGHVAAESYDGVRDLYCWVNGKRWCQKPMICNPAECKGQGSYLCSGIRDWGLTVEKQEQPLPAPHHPKWRPRKETIKELFNKTVIRMLKCSYPQLREPGWGYTGQVWLP